MIGHPRHERLRGPEGAFHVVRPQAARDGAHQPVELADLRPGRPPHQGFRETARDLGVGDAKRVGARERVVALDGEVSGLVKHG